MLDSQSIVPLSENHLNEFKYIQDRQQSENYRDNRLTTTSLLDYQMRK